MLLKFTAADMLNTSLVDVATGDKAYDIETILMAVPESFPSSSKAVPRSLSSNAIASSSKPPSPVPHMQPSKSGERRRTKIRNAGGNIVADIIWDGRKPDITIGDERIGALTDLFGSSTVRFLPKILAIPTRFDTEYIWTASANSLTLFDYDAEAIRGTFHQNSIRIPRPSKPFKISSPSKLNLSSPSTPFLSSPCLSASSLSASSSSIEQNELDHKPLKSSFIPTHLPGVGSNYLEFKPHPLAQDIEIIISFIMMEILRRGRFNLTPYTFEKPKLWQLKEARDLVWRRLRRNTV